MGVLFTTCMHPCRPPNLDGEGPSSSAEAAWRKPVPFVEIEPTSKKQVQVMQSFPKPRRKTRGQCRQRLLSPMVPSHLQDHHQRSPTLLDLTFSNHGGRFLTKQDLCTRQREFPRPLHRNQPSYQSLGGHLGLHRQ